MSQTLTAERPDVTILHEPVSVGAARRGVLASDDGAPRAVPVDERHKAVGLLAHEHVVQLVAVLHDSLPDGVQLEPPHLCMGWRAVRAPFVSPARSAV